MMILEGIDVSSYQGYVNWGEVRAAGKSFAFCKATEGVYYQDPTFAHNWPSMKYRGLVRGAYHFYRPKIDPRTQAAYLHMFVRTHGHFETNDFIVCDIEETDGVPPANIVEEMVDFIDQCKYESGKQVILYTYPDFWLNALGNPVHPALSECPLWLADYGSSVPKLAAWPGGLSFWQYSSTGHCPGVTGNVDLNRFYGNHNALMRLSQFEGNT